jgi:threonine dehydrogenase-like Zn-dependent dehydrogenase
LQGRHEKKLALARRWGCPSAATAPGETASAGERHPYVVECTGTPQALAQALSHTAPRGSLILKSTYAPNDPPQLDWARIVVDEISIIGSRCGQFAPALRLLAQGRIDVRCLIDHRKDFSACLEAFELAAQKGVLKVIVNIAPAGPRNAAASDRSAPT